VIAHLHNYCINERILETGGAIDPVVDANITGHGTFEEASQQLAEYEAVLEDILSFSGNREHVVKRIEQLGLEKIYLN
jgi:hypothetical protein